MNAFKLPVITTFLGVFLLLLAGCGLSDIAFKSSSISLETNSVAFLEFEETGTKRLGEEVFFVSADEDLASVTSGGRVLAGPNPGTTTITAFSSVDYEVSSTIEVVVTEGD